jgi:pimeloyl-ACP methyl ester carboxylesterase
MTQTSSTAVTSRSFASILPTPRTRLGRLLRQLKPSPVFRQIADACSSATNQNRLLFPGQLTRGTELANITPTSGAQLLRLAAAGDEIAALFGCALAPDGTPLDASSAPTVIFFYGNEMCIQRALGPFEFLRRLGFNVLVPEYVGYGLSGGRASEVGCYATADAAYDYLRSRDDVDPTRIGLIGCSLGGAVAIDLASRKPVSGLATLVTFTSIPDMVQLSFPRLPTSWLVRYRFESERKMRRVTCPVLIGHSTEDTRIPYAMADRLAAAAAGPVKRLRITGADHSTTELLEIAGEQIAEALVEFFGTAEA